MVEQKVSYNDASKVIRTAAQYYTSMGRNGWELPSASSALVNLDFLYAIRDGKVYCLRTEHCTNLKKCFSLPPKSVLQEKLEAFAETVPQNTDHLRTVKRLLTTMKKKPADREWMVKLLAVWCPDDEIFNKDYVWRRPKKPVSTQIEYSN